MSQAVHSARCVTRPSMRRSGRANVTARQTSGGRHPQALATRAQVPRIRSRLSAQGVASTLRLDGCIFPAYPQAKSGAMSTESAHTIGPK